MTCKKCEQLNKTTDKEFIEPWAEELYNNLASAIYDYHNEILEQSLKTDYSDLFKTVEGEKVTSFFDIIAGLLEKIYILWQEIGLGIVKDETKLIEAVAVLDFGLSFEIAPNRAVTYAKAQAGELVKNVSDNIKKEISNIVAKSLQGWRTQNELATVIYNSFWQFNAVRSKLIARQETALALSWGKYNQFVESATKYNTTGRKRAITQKDGKVRPEHVANEDAGRIPADQPFPWTNTLHDPHDYNCRCVTDLRVFKPDTKYEDF